MMDIQAYCKYFNMSGPTSYYPCMVCKMKATYGDNKMCLLGHTDLHRMPKRCEAEEKLHQLKYDLMKTEGARTIFAKKLGVKGSYPRWHYPTTKEFLLGCGRYAYYTQCYSQYHQCAQWKAQQSPWTDFVV